MATTLPAPGIYARKGSFNDRLLDGLVTVRVSVAVITPLGVEERELEFTAGDLLTAIQALLAAVANFSALSGLPLSPMLGGPMPEAPAIGPAPGPSTGPA
jgi:hypothetical protein